MTVGRIAVLSHVVKDEIYRDGAYQHGQVGGAGAFAAVGAALVTDVSRPIIVAGTGTGDLDFTATWMDARGIDPAGLFVVGEHGPVTEVRYADDVTRVEIPVHGLDHFVTHTPYPRHLPVSPAALAGVYLFHNSEATYWDEVAEFCSAFPGSILWEVAADCCLPELADEVRQRASLVDIAVLNLAEAKDLFSADDTAAALRAAASLAPMVLVHNGTEGSWLLTDGSQRWIGIRPVDAVDVTGGGNAYAGAFLQALVDGCDPLNAARLAASAAAEVVSHAGAPELTELARTKVRQGARRVPTNP